MKAGFTFLLAITDRSGSMSPILSDMENGFNFFVKEQKVVPGECHFRHVQFDWAFPAGYETVYDGPIADAPKWVLIPRARTALWDAQGTAITELGEHLANMAEDERPDKVVVMTVTDGMENASKTWTAPMVAALIKQQTEEFNWQFLYLGANQDAIAEADKMGIAASNSMTFHTSSAGITNTYESVSASVSNYRGGITNTTQLTPADRQNAMQK
jgi:hypothetical protein